MASLSKTHRKQLKLIGKAYGATVHFRKLANAGGLAYCKRRKVLLSTDLEVKYAYQALFHELGHLYAYQNKIYPAYHCHDDLDDEKKRKAFKAMALKAERWVDKWGHKEYRKVCPFFGRWERSYYSKQEIKFLKETIANHLGE